MDVWGPARVSRQGRERYFLLVVDDYTRYNTVFPLRIKGEVLNDLPDLRLHSDRGGEFSSDLLRDFCCGEGILQSFTLPDSPQQNGIAERRIALVMEVARTSMIHAAAPHFLWPFAVRYAAHQLNLWPRVFLPKTSPTLRWTGKVGDASVFWVWGSCAFVRDTSADKLSALAIPCVFLGFPLDAPVWQFYHPTSHRVFPSQDVTFDESVPFYRLFPYRSAPPPPSLLFLAPGPPPIDPLPPKGPAPSGVSQVDPLFGNVPVEVAVVSGAARGAAFGGAEPGGAEPGVAEPGGAEPGGAEPGGAEPKGVEPGGAESEGAESGGAKPWDTASFEGLAGASARGTGATGTCGGAGGAVSGGTGAGGTMRPRPFLVPLLHQVLSLPSSTGLPPSLLSPRPLHSQPQLQPGSPLPAPSPYAEQTGSFTVRREPESRPPSRVRAVCTGRRVSCPRPPPVPGTHTMALHPSSIPLCVPLPALPESCLPAVPNPESDLTRADSPNISRLLATVVTVPSFESTTTSALVAELFDFAAGFRLDYATALLAESESAGAPSVKGECALCTDVLEERHEDFECLAPAVPRFASMMLAPEGDPDAPDIPTPRSYAEAITDPYSSQWQAAMDAEMASWKSTGTYVDEVPPPGANIVDRMWILRVKRPPASPPAFKMTTLRVLLHVAAQRDYELHSLDFSTAFLQGSLHDEIWLRRPSGFTRSFPTGTQWSLRRPVYGLCRHLTLSFARFSSHPTSPVCAIHTGRRVPRPRPPPVPGTHIMALRPSSVPLRAPLPPPPESSLPTIPDPASDLARAASPTVPRLLATFITNPSFESTATSALVAELVDFATASRLDYATSLVAESGSGCPPSVEGECALSTDVLEDKKEDFECHEAAVPHLVAMLLAPEGDSDALDIPTPRSYAEAITVPPSGANIVDGMWSFRVKRPPGSSPVFKARYVARGFCQRQGVDFFHNFSPTPKMTTLEVLLHVAAQRDYELHSLDFCTAFLQGSLHEEIWLRRPPGFTGSFPASTQWSLWRPVYGLRQAPREWHDTLRRTLAALGFAPSTADPSLFLRTDTSLPPFYVLVYIDDLVFATADTEVLQRFSFRYSSPQSTPLPTGHSLLAPPSDKSVEPSGPYAELVGCLMCLMTCTRPDLADPLSILARYVAPGRHRPEQWEATKRVLRYLCSTLGMGLMLGGRGPIVLIEHADSSWVDELATQRSLQGYTFSLRSSSVSWRGHGCTGVTLAHLPADRLGRVTSFFSSSQRGQLRLAYVATRANTAYIFTKALQTGGGPDGVACRVSASMTPLSQRPPATTATTGGDFTLTLSGGAALVAEPGVLLLEVPWAVRWGSPGGGAWGSIAGGGEAPGGIDAASLGAVYSASIGAVPKEALHTFTLDSGASRCFFRDSTIVTLLTVPVPVPLADPSGGPVVARGATVLPCPAAPSGLLTGLHLPLFAKNLVATSVLQDQWVTITQPGDELVAICTDSRTGEHLAAFTRRPRSGLYTLTTESALVAESGQVAASVEVASSCSCRLLTHQTLLWHHRLGHPSFPRLRGMHSHLLVPGLLRSMPPLPRSLAPPCLPCVKGRQRAAPHSSSFPPTTAPLQTLHMDVWSPARVTGQGGERYFLLVVDDYTRCTTVFPLQSKAGVRGVLIRWIRDVRLQLRA
ncbi:unnamed protein product [Closterium sp. NIES-53]